MIDSIETEIRELLDLLGKLKARDVHHKVFGSCIQYGHRYRLGQPVSDAAITEFENRLTVRLPADFRAFLLLAGDGAAGPNYGIAPMMEMCHNVIDREFPFTSQVTYEQIIALRIEPEGPVDPPGVLKISHQGCDKYDSLILRGPAAGAVWADFTYVGGPMIPLKSTFAAWYRAWVEGCFVSLDNETVLDGLDIGVSERCLITMFKGPAHRWNGLTPDKHYIAFPNVSASFELASDDRVTSIHRFDISPWLFDEWPDEVTPPVS